MTKAPHEFRKRSLSLDGHRTSVALENVFWDALERIAEARRMSLPALVREVDRARPDRATDGGPVGLASALRCEALRWFADRAPRLDVRDAETAAP